MTQNNTQGKKINVREFLAEHLPEARWDPILFDTVLRPHRLASMKPEDMKITHLYERYGSRQTVDLRKLIYFQRYVIDGGSRSMGLPLEVCKVGDMLFLDNGYHRTIDMIKQGKSSAEAVVLDLTDPKKFHQDDISG